MTTTILPTKNLKDKELGSNKSSPQIRTRFGGDNDSRQPKEYGCLTFAKIRELRTDPTVVLARWSVLSPMIHTPWMYESVNQKASKEMLDFVEGVFTPIRDQFLMQSVFGILDYGWQGFETVYLPEGRYIVINTLKALLQEYTDVMVYTNSGQFAGYANEAPGINSSTYILDKYAQHTNFEFEGTDWYGVSTYKGLKKIQESWDNVEDSAGRYDRKVAGATWVIYYPIGVTPYNGVETSNDEIADSLLAKLEASRNLAIPDEIQEWMDDTLDREAKGKWRIEILSSDASVTSSFIDRQKYLDALKMRAFALPERSILEGTHGTKADSSVHADLALSNVDSRHRLLCQQLTNMAVRYLMQLNFGNKYQWTVRVKPAPMVDTQYATVKQIYERIMSSPEALAEEVKSIDMKSMRDELGIPTGAGLNVVRTGSGPV